MSKTHAMVASMAILAGLMAGAASAQEVAGRPTGVRPAPATARAVQPTRSYRSYSVNPARGDVRRDGPHAGDATWRHAGAKPVGHYATGR